MKDFRNNNVSYISAVCVLPTEIGVFFVNWRTIFNFLYFNWRSLFNFLYCASLSRVREVQLFI